MTRAVTRAPFSDELGHKGWAEKISHAQPHVVRHLKLEISGWPKWSRPLRVAFLSDFHTGSHSDDVTRLNLIINEAASFRPDVGKRRYAGAKDLSTNGDNISTSLRDKWNWDERSAGSLGCPT